jgi:hypothetical protein
MWRRRCPGQRVVDAEVGRFSQATSWRLAAGAGLWPANSVDSSRRAGGRPQISWVTKRPPIGRFFTERASDCSAPRATCGGGARNPGVGEDHSCAKPRAATATGSANERNASSVDARSPTRVDVASGQCSHVIRVGYPASYPRKDHPFVHIPNKASRPLLVFC